MAITKTRKSRKIAPKKAARQKPTKGFEKAWKFWKETQVDLSGFAFNREEANAR